MDYKKKNNAAFSIGLAIGIAVGVALHHLALGVSFGVIMGLALRETYERRSHNRNKDLM